MSQTIEPTADVQSLVEENEQLRRQLEYAEETLRAIRSNEVDAVVVGEGTNKRVYTLCGADEAYRIFVEEMAEGAATVDGDGTILYCNRHFAEILCSPLEKTIGASLFGFAAPEHEPMLRALVWEGLVATCRKREFPMRSTDGRAIPALFSITPLTVDGIRCACVVLTDQSEHQARLAAEAANRAKDRFLAALSHELRTPLTPVVMTLGAMELDPSISPLMREDLAMVRRNIELETRLIDDLLDVTRIVRGKIQLTPGVVDVHSLLQSALQICQGDLEQKQLHLTQEVQSSQYHVKGDAVRIQQILWNLIRNAVKFTPSGGRITIRSCNDNGQLRVDVIDSGIGISSQALQRIFNPFEQADGSITRQFGGLGLGLTISRRLAELHGGSLVARSDGPGQGATFTLILPVAAAPKQAPGGEGSADSPQRPRRALRILVVEDHDDTRRSLVRLLSRHHQVQDVRCIAEALQLADNHQFDLLISDVGLPDGSGLDLMRQLRQRYQLKGICLSGFGMDDDIDRSAQAGFQHHLTKPVDLQMLEKAIEEAAC